MPPVILILFEFFFICVEHVQDARSLGVENADEIAGRSLEHAEQHSPEDILGGQISDFADSTGIQNRTFNECTFSLDFITLFAELGIKVCFLRKKTTFTLLME